MESLTIKAPAKINLALDVLGKRPDGYHELRMIMQTVSLYDTLTIEWTPEDENITVQTETPIEGLANPHDNLVYRAAEKIKEHSGIKGGFCITLQKDIPVAAGMAGGSTDCAAALIGINRLMQLALSDKELCAIGVTLGADVPYCIKRGSMLAEGIGEKLTALPHPPHLHILLVKPDVSISTAFVYRSLGELEGYAHPDVDGMVQAIVSRDADALLGNLGNVLESAAIPAYPVVAKIKENLALWGADGVLMSGSGPTVFALFKEEAQCKTVEKMAKQMWPGYFVHACEFTDA